MLLASHEVVLLTRASLGVGTAERTKAPKGEEREEGAVGFGFRHSHFRLGPDFKVQSQTQSRLFSSSRLR